MGERKNFYISKRLADTLEMLSNTYDLSMSMILEYAFWIAYKGECTRLEDKLREIYERKKGEKPEAQAGYNETEEWRRRVLFNTTDQAVLQKWRPVEF